MISYKVNVDLSKAPNAAKMTAHADVVIESKLIEMGLVVERFVKEETPLGATKLARGSIFSEPRGAPIREVVIGSPLNYIAVLERGRRPGKFPPLAPIELWVRRKLGIGDAKEARSVAFLVARKIARVGTPGAAMFFKGFEKARPIVERLANEMGGEIVAEWEK